MFTTHVVTTPRAPFDPFDPCTWTVPSWSPAFHRFFHPEEKNRVLLVLMMAAKTQDGTPMHPECHFYRLPKDMIYQILKYAIRFW
jgi:hypothetical protein